MMNYEELYQLVDEEFGQFTVTNRLKEFTNTLSNIDDLLYLRDFLGHCSDSSRHVLFTFVVMKGIIERKGCLMNIDQLIKVLELFFDAATAVRLSDNQKVLDILAEGVAIAARFVFEQSRETFEIIMQRIKGLLNSDSDRDVEIGLKIVCELCDRFKKELKHLPITENNTVRSEFRQRVEDLAKNLKVILQRTENEVLLNETLKAMCAVFEYVEGRTASDMSLLTFTNIPRGFADESLLDHLFNALTKPVLKEKAMRVLYLTMSGTKALWTSPESRIRYIYDFAARFTDMLLCGNDLEIAKLLQRLGCQLDISFVNEEIAEKFFVNANQFSMITFAAIKDDSRAAAYVLDFWSKVRSWGNRATRSEQEQLNGTAAQVFHTFVDSILQEIEKSPSAWISELQEIPFDVLQKAWLMIDYKQALQAGSEIADILDKRADSLSSIMQSAFLIRMATAKLQSSKGSVFTDGNMERIYDSVVKVIESTNSAMSELIELMGSSENAFEDVLIEFMLKIQTHIGRRLAMTMEVDRAQNQGEIRVISIFLNRMTIILASRISTPEILRNALVTIETIINKKEMARSLRESPLVEKLLSFSLNINFEHLSLEETKASRKLLGKIYTSLISNDSDLKKLMAVYDERWDNSSSEQTVFCFYVELKGMFKGVATDKGKYAQLLLWFSNRYFKSTVEAIQQFTGNFAVVKAICELWISMFPDGLQDKRFGHNSGFGIRLFQQSVEIIDALMSRLNEEGGLQITLKVIRYCLTTECANFGVMAYYQDRSYPHVVGVLLGLISREDILTLGLMQEYKNVFNILRSISAILRVNGAAVIKNRENLEAISRLTNYFLLHYDMGTKPRLIWEETCKTVLEIFSVISTDIQLWETFTIFRPHVLIVIEALFSRYDDYLVDSAYIVLYAALYDGEFVKRTVDDLCGMFEEQHRVIVGECFSAMISGFEQPVKPADLTPFKVRANTFMSSMRKYRLGSDLLISSKL